MNWIPLQDEKQLDEIVAQSNTTPQVIFKHSTRCSVSSMAKNRLEREEAPNGIPFYLLDLIRYRNISNRIASDFGVRHQSPQVLVIDKGKCTYDESHSGIIFDEIETAALQK
ncbi:MAG TPA: bacillithiol system redox-active protein YtxJ [Hanamia sp.]|jgi:bacillithiol system protein YtxJ|nr:bacillithiol system redox-active protein YtxJ [Hanamia sp.]